VALDSTNLLDRDVVPELVEPSVIFLDDQTTLTRVDDVLAALNFACIAANAEGSYTNAVVFERYIQTLVARPDYVVPVSRQMFGSKATGTPAINLLATRPHRCGEFHEPQRDHWEALERAIDSPAAIRVMDAIRPLAGRGKSPISGRFLGILKATAD